MEKTLFELIDKAVKDRTDELVFSDALEAMGYDYFDLLISALCEVLNVREKCPRCGSSEYGQEEDGRMTCMGCHLGFDPWQPDTEYAAQYSYACGYYD